MSNRDSHNVASAEQAFMKRREVLIALAACSVSLPAASAPRAAFPMSIHNGRLFVAAQVNGRPVRALLDSGAEMSIVDTALAKSLDLTARGSIDIAGSGAAPQAATVMSGVSLRLLGKSLRLAAVVATDLSDVSRRLSDVPIRMIVGKELFEAARFEIDFAHSLIKTGRRQGTMPGVHLPLTTEHGVETIPISISGCKARAVLDLGNGSRPSVSAEFLERCGLLTGRSVNAVTGGGIGGTRTLRAVRLNCVRIGRTLIDDVEFTIAEGHNVSDANVGTLLLKAFCLTIDFAARSAWIR